MNKRKVLKVLMSVFLSVVLLTNSSLVSMCHASTYLGQLSYWYSDGNSIGRWKTSSINVYVESLNSNSPSQFYGYVGYGCAQWSEVNDVVGINFSVGTAYTDSSFKVYWGTEDEINAKGVFTVDSTVNGKTATPAKTLEGYWLYKAEMKYQYQYTQASICIIDKDHTTAQYRKTATHEIGHALGWSGHSDNSSDVMYSNGSTVTSLTSRDINHLAQVY